MINKELERRRLPDFFKNISSKEDWENSKSSIMELFLNEEYGHLPPTVTPSVRVEENWIDFAGKGKWEFVYLTFEHNGKEHTVKTDLILPTDAENVPVFVYIGMNPEIPSKYLPVEEILDSGFGIYTFWYEDVTSDSGERNGLAQVFDSDCGKISYWAYMAQRCMDYLETRSEVDAGSVAVIGHSRLGKTALLASALDDRFMLTCSNDSGCCGAALSRGKIIENETVRKITEVFPFWFNKSFLKYVDNEDALPFDQHLLLSMIAPRQLMIGTAIKDVWADNDGQFLSCVLASRVWELYGKYGLASPYEIPKSSVKYLDGCVSFHLREGTHFLSRNDWQIYIEKFKMILGDKQ